MVLKPGPTEAVEHETTITLTVTIKTLNRPILDDQLIGYIRHYLDSRSDTEVYGDLREVWQSELLVKQDEIDNATYEPCIRCGDFPVCECSDDDIARRVMALSTLDGRLGALGGY